VRQHLVQVPQVVVLQVEQREELEVLQAPLQRQDPVVLQRELLDAEVLVQARDLLQSVVVQPQDLEVREPLEVPDALDA